MKKIVSVLSFFVISISSVAFAETILSPEAAYQNTTLITPNELTIPTVVEIPFGGSEFTQESFLVVEKETGDYVPHRWRDSQNPIKTPWEVFFDGAKMSTLSDGNFNTTASFELQTSAPGIAMLSIVSGQTPLTTSEIQFDFSRNVIPPKSIAINALGDDGVPVVVLATTTFPGSRVRFPSVNTNSLQVTLEYIQPLRIAEVIVVEEAQGIEVVQGLRFLAQPGRTYEVFSNPDRAVEVAKREGGNLTINDGVVLQSSPNVFPNPRYVPSDRDADTVVDTRDNCPDVPNQDQADANNNQEGDACEDYDRDGVMNSMDNCPDLPNFNQSDEDGDQIGDACDDQESRLTEKYAWALWAVLGLVALILGGLFAIVVRQDPALATKRESETNE